MRRYLTVLRRIGSAVLVDQMIDALVTEPDLARSTLEYARAFPITRRRARSLFFKLDEVRGLYQDVALLIVETLASAPNPNDRTLWKETAEQATELVKELSAQPIEHGSYEDWLCAGLVTLVAKFGSADQRRAFANDVWVRLPKDSYARLQGLSLVLGDRIRRLREVDTNVPGLPWTIVLNVDFLRAIEEHEDRATGILLGLLQPEVRLQPNRWHVHPRPAGFARLIALHDPARVRAFVPRFIWRLSTNPERLRDRRLEALYKEVLTLAQR